MSPETQSLHWASHAEQPWPQPSPRRVFCDAALCTPLTLDLPPLSKARLAQALRWAAEEHLAGSAEEEHVVAGPRDEDGRLCALVIRHSVMEEITAHWPEGQGPDQLLPDALCLPWQPGQLCAASWQGRVLARWGRWSFACFEPEEAAELLSPLHELRWHWLGGALPAALRDQPWQQVDERADVLALLDATADGLDVNLLTGPWASAAQHRERQRWPWVAGLALAVVAALSAHAALEHRLLQQQSARMQAQLDAQFEAMFPGVRPAGRHRELAEREWARRQFGQAAGVLDLLAQVTPVMAAQAVVVQSLQYRDGRLDLSLRAEDVASLDQLAQRLRALGLQAAVQSASLDDQGANAQLQIMAGPTP